VIHAIGPGHGKSIACSYFLSQPGNFFRGILMANLITTVHVISGAAIILVLYFVLKKTGMSSFEDVNPAIQKVSYSFLMAIGLFLAARTVHELKTGKLERALTEFGLDESGPSPEAWPGLKSMIAISIATGIVPCPGAAIILSFSLILEIAGPGIAAMFFIALGMGITTSAFALVAIYSRKTVLKIIGGSGKKFRIAYATLSFTGAAAIIVLSGLLLAGT